MTARFRACCWLGALIAPIYGCASFQTPEPLPTMSEIRSKPPDLVADLLNESVRPRPVIDIQVMDLPLKYPLGDAWSVVDEQVLPKLARTAWNRNGLRVGLLHRAQVQAFYSELPDLQGVHDSNVVTGLHPVPVLRSPGLPDTVTVDLTIPPGAVYEKQIRRGRMQLLARILDQSVRTVRFEILPHHFKPNRMTSGRFIRDQGRVRYQPRSALEKELDGSIFRELALQVDVSPGQVLVIGMYWPWGNSDRTSVHVGNTNQVDPARRAVATLLEPPLLPSHIGRLLFTAVRPGGAVQKIMLISIQKHSPVSGILRTHE